MGDIIQIFIIIAIAFLMLPVLECIQTLIQTLCSYWITSLNIKIEKNNARTVRYQNIANQMGSVSADALGYSIEDDYDYYEDDDEDVDKLAKVKKTKLGF